MKFKHLRSTFFLAVFFLGTSASVNAQDYKTAAGLGIDFGLGRSLVGPSLKRFVTPRSALQGELLLGSGVSIIQGLYQYHLPIKEVQGLKFYFGGGPGAIFVPGDAAIFLRPTSGLEYKMKAPLVLHFDWRPILILDQEVLDFEPVRFGLGLKYSF